eukprot:CAMPEP_0194138824 /NCGR_PEP_ID=MMETSP0152-20130528/8570_1 /TAXON_ID=1049557 /ORGANISM="Thalassiothrix antarctica, Strain L6-D1" /LENGTH=212 /DNA_ID=CAMNT_0038836425 /DNA_START=468 /DNA_END=1103 /DNA_ORIENTATION=+
MDDDDGTTTSYKGGASLDGSFLGIEDKDGSALDYLLDIKKEEEKVHLSKMVFQHHHHKGAISAGYGFINPNTKKGYYSFEFDCPNFGFFPSSSLLPVVITIQLSAFAREMDTYDSEEEYEIQRLKDASNNNFSMASQFFGSGSFMNEEKKNTHASMVGQVIQTELRRNELTQQLFYWALVRTAGDMEIDVVIHPDLLKDKKSPKVGGIIKGW